MLDDGDKAVCLYDGWFNAFGDECHALHEGMAVTVVATKNINGTRFLAFRETPKGNYYMASGFDTLKKRTLH